MQCGKLICLYSYFLYIPLPILCHYLYFYRFISLQCFLVVQTLCLYIYLKADFKRVQSLSLLKDSASCSYFISPGTFVSALVLLTRLSSANPFGLFATHVCCSQTSESWFWTTIPLHSASLWTLSDPCSTPFFFSVEEFWGFWHVFRSLKYFSAQIFVFPPKRASFLPRVMQLWEQRGWNPALVTMRREDAGAGAWISLDQTFLLSQASPEVPLRETIYSFCFSTSV